MVVREEYPPGVPCWVDIAPPDVEVATAFYGHVFGWRFDDRTPPGSARRYLVAQLDAGDDAGAARIAVIEDPHGASFTVSRYQPE